MSAIDQFRARDRHDAPRSGACFQSRVDVPANIIVDADQCDFHEPEHEGCSVVAAESIQNPIEARDRLARVEIHVGRLGVDRLAKPKPAEGRLAPQLIANGVRGDRDEKRAQGLRLAQRVHALEQREEDLLHQIIDLVLGAERALQHPVDHRREALPRDPRPARVPFD